MAVPVLVTSLPWKGCLVPKRLIVVLFVVVAEYKLTEYKPLDLYFCAWMSCLTLFKGP